MAIADRMKRMHNCVGVSFNSSKGFSGQVYTCYKKEPDAFNDVTDFFTIVNTFLDILEYPASKVRFRAFKRTLPTLKLVDIDPSEKLFDTETLLKGLGGKGYIIMMTSRDNATWQGKIYDVSKDTECDFNSEVELLKVINR